MKEIAKVELESYDSLYGEATSKGNEAKDTDTIQYIETDKLKTFHDHPFIVKDDKDMQMLEASIRENGILSPILVRPLGGGTYEIISGHRRRQVAMIAGIRKVPVIIREMDDDTAAIEVVNANKQRKNMSICEKARAYTLEFNALLHRGRPGEHTLTIMKNIHGDSERNIQRYMELMRLPMEMLELVDAKQIKFIPAVTVSQISKDFLEQLAMHVVDGKKLTLKKAEKILDGYRKGTLTDNTLAEIMNANDEPVKDVISVDYKRIREYIPEGLGKRDVPNIIEAALKFWYANKNTQETKDM